MPEALTAARLRLVFDLFTKTDVSVPGVARIARITEDMARDILRGETCGRERVAYGVRRMGLAADARGVPLMYPFVPPRYGPHGYDLLPEEEFPEFRALLRTTPPDEHRTTIRRYSND